MSEVLCAAKRRNILGEGPCWDDASGRLYWLDIRGQVLEWLRPADRHIGLWTLERMASAIAPRGDGTLLMAVQGGLGVFDPAVGEFTLHCPLEADLSANRTNDGKTDPAGRFWVGTMDDAGKGRSGSVYRIDPDWRCTRVIEGLGIPNTLTFSPDGALLYVADSQDGVIWVYAVDPGSDDLGRRRLFVDTSAEGFSPDGSAMDVEGRLWNAQWGGWRVVCYRPDGQIDRVVEMPVAQPTSCAFGGPDLSTLYITSARDELSEAELDDQPLAGSLFSLRPGVKGAPVALFAG
jgi:sugar lactone lactonase YvrE